jgi:hypothetical protein
VEIVDNATRLKARLLEQGADPTRPGWLRVSLAVSEAGPCGVLPSLIHAAAGEALTVLVGPEDRPRVEALTAGASLVLQLRLRAPGVHTVVPGSVSAE